MSDTLLALMVAGALVLAVLAVNSFRVVPADERLVRFRRGRRGHQVKGPGLVVVLPGIDRGVRLPLRRTWADVMWLEATTRDGVSMTVNGAALIRVRPGSLRPVHQPTGAGDHRCVGGRDRSVRRRA
jgi:regulator of protease activity HflC (stomatin/prohibitin superfamily)